MSDTTVHGVRCSSMVRAFAHGVMGRRIDPSWGGPIELFLISARFPLSLSEWSFITMFYLTTHSTHFIYGYMASNIWLRTILIVREETFCHHIGYSFWLAPRVLLYAPSHIQDSTYHSLCYTSRGALAGTKNSSMGLPWRIDPTI